jgi:lipopolysaccharide transport system ATP-binding protein
MSDTALQFDEVWKKFKKGEKFDSLRDLIPSMVKRMLSGNHRGELQAKEFWALKDVSFEVRKGEALGIIGPNGAGKSTILKLLSGILRANKGEIRVNGRLSALIEVGAGFHTDLTGRENIYLNGAILGMDKGEIKNKFDEIVEFSGLSEFIDTPVKRYSTGMYARLGFSVAAHVNSDILLIDEVLSVGDWAFQRKCMEKMTTVMKGGATVIFVSHNLRAVASLCEKTLLLNHGEVVGLGSTEESIRQYIAFSSIQGKDPAEKEVFISKLIIRDEKGECVQFQPGQKAWVDLSISSKIKCKNLSIGIHMLDENNYPIFNTSSERLGYDTFALEAGETRTFTFGMTMHLARGTFFVGATIKRYDIERNFDDLFSAATIYVNSEKDVRGAANLYPEFYH